ncbi:MAG: DEAD/DEAH box helicase, partial [Planctomycetes bacterium]|nr:DEAD/DEAH box helicase [Planctomycetota bacterium]
NRKPRAQAGKPKAPQPSPQSASPLSEGKPKPEGDPKRERRPRIRRAQSEPEEPRVPAQESVAQARAERAEARARTEREPQAPAPTKAPSEPAAPIPTEYGPKGRIIKWKQFTLSPFQIQSVDAVRQGHNVLVAAPTGAGKTLVAEYAIEDAVQRGKRCIYTSPIKALSSQKYRDFKADPNIDVGIMTGDVTLNPNAQVLVMTTEILRNAIFENTGMLQGVEFVIFDEIHYMDDLERGTVWEESLIFLPREVRLICLSATVSNVLELGNWLTEIRDQETVIVQEASRPVPLSHWVWTEESGVFDPSKLNFQRKRAEQIVQEQKKRKSFKPRGRRDRRGGRSGRVFSPPPDPTSLLLELAEKNLLPALVFSFSRKDCERLARRCQKLTDSFRLLSREEQRRMEDLQEELIELFQLNRGMLRGEIMAMAREGVGYHHAGMLPVHKELVERMFTHGLLKLLFTTETFALGINMPARSVVFNGLKKYDGVNFDWLRTRDYMQMAGRAGRQGIDEKGFVYCIQSPSDLIEAPLERLFAGKPEPVTSRFRLSYASLLHLIEHLGRERLFEAWEKSFHYWQTRDKNKKVQERQRRQQRRLVESHLSFLEAIGYIENDLVTPRGRLARQINGYEIQATELIFHGTLDALSARSLAMTAVALIFEERRRFGAPTRSRNPYQEDQRLVSNALRDAFQKEAQYGIEPGMKRPDWGLTPAVMAWYGGGTLEDVEETTEATLGDVCRVFRMAIQLLRNLRRAIDDPKWDLSDRLEEALVTMNRDEIDARRQLELG